MFRRWLILPLIVACLLSHRTALSQVRTRLSQDQLRAFTERALANGDAAVLEPEFKLNRESSTLEYNLGGAFMDQPGDDSAFDNIVDLQFQVTVIRRYRNNHRQRKFWTPVLTEAEREIATLLKKVSAEENPERRFAIVMEGKQTVEQIYGTALIRLAKEEGLEHISTEVAGPRFYVVNIVAFPADGRVECMSAGQWSLYLLRRDAGDNPPKPDWETLDNEKREMFGRYWFRIVKGDRELTKQLIRIQRSGQITLRAN